MILGDWNVMILFDLSHFGKIGLSGKIKKIVKVILFSMRQQYALNNSFPKQDHPKLDKYHVLTWEDSDIEVNIIININISKKTPTSI